MNEIVWGNFTQEELDRNYDQSLVPNVGVMEQNAADSAKIREELGDRRRILARRSWNV